ncbi:hypothetical protein ACHAXR_012460 [Thalassiosira sp. AJA248-18]
MAPKSKKKQSPREKYGNMTLDDLAKLDDANDDEIDEEEAFNSEDEKVYGKYFSSSSSKILSSSKNLSLPIPLQHNTVRIVEIAMGGKMTLSSVCLDVSTFDFDQVKLMYRCIYPNQPVNQVDDFSCLCNYLSVKKGGMGLMPSTPVDLAVIGPCKVEFRADVSPAQLVGGGINIFGIIFSADHDTMVSDDVAFRYADAFMSEEEEDVESENEGVEEESSSQSGGDNGKVNDKTNEVALKATKKRKLEEEADENITPSKQTPAESKMPESSDKKLSKKQRKKLAQEKAKQLEETLAAARNTTDDDANDEGPAKKKSKKKKKETNESLSKKTSMTRERRLAGGLVISDILLGAGVPVKPGKRISLHYTGSIRSTGKVFDKNNSKQHPLVFRQGTGEVVRGLERGLEGMKVGGERVITVPSKLGYGSKGAGVDIPPDSDLVFEVKVLKVG